jgi:predicted murein hydrolase (TIGR00659 family)
MTPNLSTMWVYLSASPLIWLTATLLSYRLAYEIYARTGFHPLAHPVAISVAILVAVLSVTGTPYRTYFDGAQFVHFLLGPATVALAIPFYQHLDALRRNWFALLMGALAGGATGIATAMGIAAALGATHATVLSMAAKSVTTPIAMGITEKIGGLPSLTSALVVLTGILGATIAPSILSRMKITDDSIRGFAIGTAAHGIGTSRAFQISEEAGAFSGLAMGLSGVLTALLLPFVLKLMQVI